MFHMMRMMQMAQVVRMMRRFAWTVTGREAGGMLGFFRIKNGYHGQAGDRGYDEHRRKREMADLDTIAYPQGLFGNLLHLFIGQIEGMMLTSFGGEEIVESAANRQSILPAEFSRIDMFPYIILIKEFFLPLNPSSLAWRQGKTRTVQQAEIHMMLFNLKAANHFIDNRMNHATTLSINEIAAFSVVWMRTIAQFDSGIVIKN